MRRATRPERGTAGRGLGRAGFTLTDTLVAIALAGIVAGVVLSRMTTPQEGADVAALSQNLSTIGSALQGYRGDVGRYPARVSHLATPPPPDATDLCGRSVPDHQRDAWRGPYLNRTLTGGGLDTGAGIVADELERDPRTHAASSFGLLLVRVNGVDGPVAERLDEAFDGDEDLDGGTVRWQAGRDGQVGTLFYALPVRGC